MQFNSKGDIRYSKEELKTLRKTVNYVKNLDLKNKKKSISKKVINKKIA